MTQEARTTGQDTSSTNEAGEAPQAASVPGPEALASMPPAPGMNEAADGTRGIGSGGGAETGTTPSGPARVTDPAQQAPFDALSSVVLDAADVASQAARAAADAAQTFRTTEAALSALSHGVDRKYRLTMAIVGAVLVCALGLFLAMGIRISSRVAQLDATVLAVGKRAVELEVSVQSLERFTGVLNEMSERQQALAEAQSALERRIETVLQQSTAALERVPEQAARQISASSDGLVKQVQGLDTRLQAQLGAARTQARAVESIGQEVKQLNQRLDELGALRREVQTFVDAQRAREQEQLRRAAPPQRESAVQYPRSRPQKPTSEPAER